MRAELLFAVLASLSVPLGVVIAGRERRGLFAFVQLVLVATAATAFGKAGLTEVQSYFAQEEPSALTLVLLLVGLPLAGVAVDRVAGLVIRRDGLRFGLELAAAAVALMAWGEPLSTAALDAPMANLPPATPGAPAGILVSPPTTAARPMSTAGSRAVRLPDGFGPAALQAALPGRAGNRCAGARMDGRRRAGPPRLPLPQRPRAASVAAAARALRPLGARAAAGGATRAQGSLHARHPDPSERRRAGMGGRNLRRPDRAHGRGARGAVGVAPGPGEPRGR